MIGGTDVPIRSLSVVALRGPFTLFYLVTAATGPPVTDDCAEDDEHPPQGGVR